MRTGFVLLVLHIQLGNTVTLQNNVILSTSSPSLIHAPLSTFHMQPSEASARSPIRLKGGEHIASNISETEIIRPRRNMTRSLSEVTFPSPDSYAFSYGTDLGFSLFLERRCKRIYFIGNAEGLHNTVPHDRLRSETGGDEFFDAGLTPKGREECFNLQMDILHRVHPIDFQLIVVSPLTRALQTAELALGNLPRATPTHSRAASRAVSPQPEPLTMLNGSTERDLHKEFAALDRAMLTMSLNAEATRGLTPSSNTTTTDGSAAAAAGAVATDWHRRRPTVPMIATELCRERITGLPCDRRRPVRELRREFPRVSFALLRDDDDPAPAGAEEDKDMCCRRAARFLQWLSSRPEQRIAVVSHSGFLLHLFEHCGMSRHRQLGPKDVGELRRRPLHAEMRAVLLAAHRKVEEGEIRHGLVELLGDNPTPPPPLQPPPLQPPSLAAARPPPTAAAQPASRAHRSA